MWGGCVWKYVTGTTEKEACMGRMAPVEALRAWCVYTSIGREGVQGVGVYTELLGSASAGNAPLYIEFVHGCPGAKAPDMRSGQPKQYHHQPFSISFSSSFFFPHWSSYPLTSPHSSHLQFSAILMITAMHVIYVMYSVCILCLING